MRAVQINHRAIYSSKKPAPPSSLVFNHDVPMPQFSRPGQVLVKVHGATVTRDELTWPEMYESKHGILGFDLSGTVAAVSEKEHPSLQNLKPGDKVFGLTTHGGTWAEYALAEADELVLMPQNLSWAQGATVPMNGLTAWQALFEKCDVKKPDFNTVGSNLSSAEDGEQRSVLITGASGAVGMYLVQLAAIVGLHVVAVSSSVELNSDFLKTLGATEVAGYAELAQGQRKFDIIIDTVGGEFLQQCWLLVAEKGTLITVDSASLGFEEHRPAGTDGIKASSFIVKPSGDQMIQLARALELGLLKPFVACEFPLAEGAAAYELANGRTHRRGKVALII